MVLLVVQMVEIFMDNSLVSYWDQVLEASCEFVMELEREPVM